MDLIVLGSDYDQMFQIPGSAPCYLLPEKRKNSNLNLYHGQDPILTHGLMCKIRQG